MLTLFHLPTSLGRLFGALALMLAADCLAQPAFQGGVTNSFARRALILSDGGDHEWRNSTSLLRRLLEEAGGWEVRICESPVGITTEFLDPFDVVVADYSGPAVGQLVIFSKAVSPGTAEF